MGRMKVLLTACSLGLCGIFVFGLVNPNSIHAKPYYVSIDGDNANSGTESNPVRTIAKGISLLKKGDTVFIKSGTYHEAITSNWQTIPTGTSWDDAPVIAAFPGDTVVLQPGGAGSGEVVALAHSYIQYVIFDGLIIDAANRGFGLATTNGAHHIRFQNMEIKNAHYSGVLVSAGEQTPPHNTNLEFIGCNIHHNGHDHLDHGLYITTSRNVIKQSRIHHNASFGVHVYHKGDPSQRANQNLIVGNEIYNNSTNSASAAGILLSSGDGNMAYNNIVYGNKTGIHVHNNNPKNSKVYNNTVYKNGDGIYISSLSSGAIVKNNIVYQNSNNMIQQGVNTDLASNLMANPSFIDEVNGDFRLQEGSLAVDQGVDLGEEVSHDFTNQTVRPQKLNFDIGAYEFIGSDSQDDNTPPLTPIEVRIVDH